MFLKDNLVLLSLLALILLVLAVLGFVFRVATRPEKEVSGTTRALVRLRNDTLRASFRQAVELIEENLASRAQRYSLPWVLVLNEGRDSKSLALGQSGIAQALSTDSSSSASAQGINWHFFDKGILIDMLGAYLGSLDQENDSHDPWNEFLGLCHDYRPERPFDSIVITVSASLLKDNHPDVRLELAKLAKLANRRLWLAQNRFAMRFAVYVVITDCEKLKGFSAFSRALPDLMRKSLLGWSSTLELAASYQPNWVDEALNQTIQMLSDTSAELFALNSHAEESAAFFVLPGQFENCRAQLQLYVDELMRPSAYHEPFLLRGIYFTGDAGQAAENIARMASSDKSELQAMSLAENSQEAATFADNEVISVTRSHELAFEPVFLRDLFEQKIFAEYGLARPSSRHFFSKPLMGLGSRWVAWVLIGGWGIGLVAGSFILHSQSKSLQQVFTRLSQDNETQIRATRNGLSLSVDQQNARALALLQVMEQLDTKRLWSVFMPGSWPIFDTLSTHVRERLEQTFGEVAAVTLQRGLIARISGLTGVSQEEITSEQIASVTCGNPLRGVGPQQTPKSVRETVDFEDVVEFTDLQGFITTSEQIEQALQALERLQSSSLPANGNDLRILVKLVMGIELNNMPQRSAELFRSKSVRTSHLALAPIREAMRCGLRQVSQRLNIRVLDENDLLSTLHDLDARISDLNSLDATGINPDEDLASLQELLDAIKAEATLLATGNGKWMQQANLQPGAGWERTLIRIRNLQLFGSEDEQKIRVEAENAFQRFKVNFAQALKADDIVAPVWNGKDGRYEQSSEIIALRDSLNTLLAQPYMKTGRKSLPIELPSTTAMSWDLVRLDQALAKSEQLKHFMLETLVRFPEEMHTPVERIVKMQLARQVMDQVNSAIIPGSRTSGLGTDLALVEAERGRLVKLQLLLGELGAQHEVEALRNFIAQDALRRLQVVDDALQRSELYAIRGRNFDFWQGEKSPILPALAVPDAASLQSYLAQQVMRIETLSKEADMLISLLDGASSRSFLAQRWQDLSRDLERYRLKNPNSSLNTLESFLLAMGGDVDGQNCTERLSGRTSLGKPANYFAERFTQIEVSLSQRCSELRQRDQQLLWNNFAVEFNNSVASRPPFAPIGWTAEAAAVKTDEILPLFKFYERARPAMLMASRKNTSAAAETRRFIDQFDRSRHFLAPLYPAEEGALTGLDLAVEFRANQMGEVEGNKIIDWTLEVGNQRLSLRDPVKPLRWEPGQSIQLSLRLAKDGPVSLRPQERRKGITIDGKTVTFKYADAWSLLSLFNQHREADARGDGRSQLLKFEFPLIFATEPSVDNAKETLARVYLRLTVSPAGKRVPLSWPGPFPTYVPLPG